MFFIVLNHVPDSACNPRHFPLGRTYTFINRHLSCLARVHVGKNIFKRRQLHPSLDGNGNTGANGGRIRSLQL